MACSSSSSASPARRPAWRTSLIWAACWAGRSCCSTGACVPGAEAVQAAGGRPERNFLRWLASTATSEVADSMIKTEHLSKRYETVTAVEDVTFEVRPGEVLGFLGPNGAGKTTTMRMLAGFVTPTAGKASICGHDVETEPLAAKERLGYLPEGAPSYGEMRVRRFLEFVADLRRLEGSRRRARLDYVIGRLQLASVLEQSIETLSKGFRRRVGLAQAIIHDPPVLILDEPTDGLDPNQKFEVRTLINEMARDKIIVISTHILEEVDAVCTRAIIIAGGRIVANDTPVNLVARSETGRLEDVFRSITA